MSRPTLPTSLSSNVVSSRKTTTPPIAMPLSPPSTVASPSEIRPATSGPTKPNYSTLTPLPLSPPVLKPSVKPPLSLDAPNPTTRTNFSPTVQDFPVDFPISGYTHRRPTIEPEQSHSASASLVTPDEPAPPPLEIKQRSPSQPHLPTYFSSSDSQNVPAIPLRITSIPANNKPRKLSLPVHRSMTHIQQRKEIEEQEKDRKSSSHSDENAPLRRVSPPLNTTKTLPEPPRSIEEERRTRAKVRTNSPPEASSPPRRSPTQRESESYKRSGLVWPPDSDHPSVTTAAVEAQGQDHSARKSKSQSRVRSATAPTSASLAQPFDMPDLTALAHPSLDTKNEQPPQLSTTAAFKPSPRVSTSSSTTTQPPIPDRTKSRSQKQRPSISTALNTTNPKKLAAQITEAGGWAAGTKADGKGEDRRVGREMSKTQKEKERKKRSKAKILIEHVDIIRDEFWEKRPWILSGKLG